MTTLICDFQDIVGKKIDGYATLTAGKVRPSYDSPSLVVHNPTKQRVDAGQTTFVNVNPGEAVITLEWDEQSATIRFVVPESDDAVYLSDCLSGEYLDPDELELLRWSIQNQLSGAREILETAKNLGLTEINGSTEAYFTEAAEILRKALEAALLAEQSLETIDDKVAGTEGVVTDVDEAKQKIQDLLDELATLELELGGTNADLAGAVETINTLSPQVDAATQAASAATQKAQNAVNELSAVQDANAAEFIEIKKDLDSATQTAKQATDAVAQTNQQLGLEVQRILGEVAVSLDTANEATNQARIANDNLETYQYQLGEIQQEQAHIIGQQAEIVGNYGSYTAELDRISAEIATAASELDTISGEQSALVTEMNTQVGSLQELTALQGAAINAAKQVADTANTKADTAQSAFDNLEIGVRNWFSYAYLADRSNWTLGTYSVTKDVIQLEPNTEYTFFAQEVTADADGEWTVLDIVDGTNGPITWNGPGYKRLRGIYNRKGSETPLYGLTERFTAPASGKIYFAYYDTNRHGTSPAGQWVTDKLVKAQIVRGKKIPDWSPSPEDVEAGIAKAQAEAETARAEATSKSDAARVAAEIYAKEQAEAAQADAEVEAARAALEIAQREAQAAQEAAAEDATTKADAARTAAETLAKAEAKAAKEAAEATAALDASTKANNAKAAAEAKAATLATAAKDAAATALTGYKNLNDPKVTKAQQDATKGINAAAAARSAADQAALDATNKSKAARDAAEDYAREAAEAAQAEAEEYAAAEALRVAQLEATAAKNAAATDAQTKADEAERLAKVYADAQAKSAKEQAEANAAKDAATKAENARRTAEANAKVLSDKAQQAANAAQSSIDNLEIGGRNLARRRNLAGSGQYQTVVDTGEKFWTGEPIYYGEKLTSGTPPTTLSSIITIEPGETYTVSMWVKGETDSGTTNANILFYHLGVNKSLGGTRTGSPASDWHLITGTVTNDTDAAYERVSLYFYINRNPGEKTWFTSPKLERGNKATDWTPAPEDVDESVAKAQAEAELARAEATSKSNAAQAAAEKYAKEQAEAVQADAEVEAARVALEIAQREAKAAKDAAAKDATAKANAARTAAETLAKAEAKAAKEAAEATAAADASTKANKAKTDAEAKAAQLATAAQNAAATALSTYKGQNDPKVTKAQNDATSGITKADAAKKQADKGVSDAATALARANEANNKLPAITADVSAAAQTALEAVNALPGIRTDISTAKKQADKGVQDAATAKSAVDSLEIGGRNLVFGTAEELVKKVPGSSIYTIPANASALQDAVGKVLTLSFDAVSDVDGYKGDMYVRNDAASRLISSFGNFSITTEKQHYEFQVTLASGVLESDRLSLAFRASATGTMWITNLKLERGTRATDWTPAPEDVDAGITTAQTTAETALTEAETKASQALQDATTALTNYQKVNDPKVTTAQTTANTAKSAADTAKQRADKGVSDAATAKSAADTAKARADKGVSDAATAKTAADTAKARADKGVSDAAAAKQAADKVGTDLENLQIGGRNLLLASNPNSSKTNGYPWGRFNLTETLQAGEIVTISIKGTLPEGRTSWMVFNSGGTQSVAGAGTLPPNNGGIVTWTGPWKVGSASNTYVNVYTARNTTEHSTYPGEVHLEWIKLERGSKATDWSPAPEDTQAEINSLITKAGELTTGLANAATQKQYNDLNTKLWGGQGDINKLQGDINANNSAFQTWQKTINDQQKKWNDASTNATAALARFAITQSQWNDISGKATNANTKAIAAHAALFDGQNKWNEVAAAAIAAQATLLAKQDLWNAAQQDVNTKQGRWNDAAKEILDSTGKFQKLQKQFNADQKLWNATQTLVNDAQKGINALNTKTDEAQNDAILKLQNAIALANPGVDVLPKNPETGRPYWADALTPREDLGMTFYGGINGAASQRATRGIQQYDGMAMTYQVTVMVRHTAGTSSGLSLRMRKMDGTEITPRHYHGGAWDETQHLTAANRGVIFISPGSSASVAEIEGFSYFQVTFDLDPNTNRGDFQWTPTFTTNGTANRFEAYMMLEAYPTHTINAINALTKATNAQSILSSNQQKWNDAAQKAIDANTTALAAKKVLDDNQSKWIQGANLAINNLQTTSTKFKQWTDGASLAIANLQTTSAKFKQWTKAATEAQDALQAVVGLPGDNFNGTLIGQVSNLGAELDHRLRDVNEEIQTLQSNHWMTHYWSKSGGNWHGNDWFNVTRNSNGSVNITAKGTWVGEATVNAVRNQTLPGELSKAMHTPFQWQWGIDTNRTYTLPTPGPYGTEEVISLIINFRVNPGTAVNQPYSTRDYVPAENNWRTLWTHTVPAATSVSAELHVGWDAATNGDKYGIRILVDGVQRAVDGPRTGVGPLTPLGNGYRTMDVSVKGQSIAAGKTVQFQVQTTGNTTARRKIRDARANVQYKY